MKIGHDMIACRKAGEDMAEFWGDAEAVARQERLLSRRALLCSTPFLSSGGRLLGYTDPTLGSWDVAGPLAEADGIIGLLLMTRQDADAIVAGGLGEGWRTDYWDALIGEADDVVEACGRFLASSRLPEGWSANVMQVPGDADIEDMQRLNATCGVASNPAYVFRGETHPALSVLVRDGDGRAMAMAWAGLFFHPDGPCAGTVFVGLVSVADEARGLGLGTYVNARVLVESQATMGWSRATEFVASDNIPSRRMVMACGLTHDDGLVAAIATRGAGRFTR
jgi:GNAT superfamily N-acetyltransferase